MSSAADWSMDFCLYCDKHTSEGAYCSQACRSADLEKAEPSYGAMPSPSGSVQSECSSLPRGMGFFLPPAIDFSTYKTSRTASTSPSRNSSSPSTDQRSLQNHSEDKRPLSRDTGSTDGFYARGRSAHNSIDSTNLFWNQQQTILSDKTKRELQQYNDCFEDSRYKRRRSLGLF